VLASLTVVAAVWESGEGSSPPASGWHEVVVNEEEDMGHGLTLSFVAEMKLFPEYILVFCCWYEALLPCNLLGIETQIDCCCRKEISGEAW
jgi:hypothetical protein